MKKTTIIILTILAAITLYILMPKIIKDNNEYSRYICATQGLASDCIHKLPASEELK
jgi:hypothetical protein